MKEEGREKRRLVEGKRRIGGEWRCKKRGGIGEWKEEGEK